jgi:hypothetical protein
VEEKDTHNPNTAFFVEKQQKYTEVSISISHTNGIQLYLAK